MVKVNKSNRSAPSGAFTGELTMLAKKNTRKEEAACYRDVRAPFRANIFIAAGAGSAIKIKFTRVPFGGL